MRGKIFLAELRKQTCFNNEHPKCPDRTGVFGKWRISTPVAQKLYTKTAFFFIQDVPTSFGNKTKRTIDQRFYIGTTFWLF